MYACDKAALRCPPALCHRHPSPACCPLPPPPFLHCCAHSPACYSVLYDAHWSDLLACFFYLLPSAAARDALPLLPRPLCVVHRAHRLVPHPHLGGPRAAHVHGAGHPGGNQLLHCCAAFCTVLVGHACRCCSCCSGREMPLMFLLLGVTGPWPSICLHWHHC